jgi:hypothetical protein
MANWPALQTYIRQNYKIAEDSESSLKLIFETGNLRSQLVIIRRSERGDSGEEWVTLQSPVGSALSVDLPRAASLAADYICGGLVIAFDLVLLRHSMPLADLSINEFEVPLLVVVNGADHIEAQLSTADTY